ncbi:MAG: hypothetical protein IOMNBAOH_02531 [Rhodocyclaceae bacterium]|nr:transposase [Rhodocyclaceae bacterium]MCG3187851.1 hypothetical protein [Rhodocyclaceae bacterium]
MLQYRFTRKQPSATAGVTFWNFYSRLFPGSVKSPQLVEFLSALSKQIKGKLLIIWDGLKAHKSRLVRAFVESKGDRIVLDYLPAYALELNPVEYVWGYLKTREMANLCATSIHEVADFARRRLKSMQRRHTRVTAFWKQAELPVAGGQLLAIGIEQRHRLTEGEQMLGTPVAAQGLLDVRLGGADADVLHLRQHAPVAFAGDDGAHDLLVRSDPRYRRPPTP